MHPALPWGTGPKLTKTQTMRDVQGPGQLDGAPGHPATHKLSCGTPGPGVSHNFSLVDWPGFGRAQPRYKELLRGTPMGLLHFGKLGLLWGTPMGIPLARSHGGVLWRTPMEDFYGRTLMGDSYGRHLRGTPKGDSYGRLMRNSYGGLLWGIRKGNCCGDSYGGLLCGTPMGGLSWGAPMVGLLRGTRIWRTLIEYSSGRLVWETPEGTLMGDSDE